MCHNIIVAIRKNFDWAHNQGYMMSTDWGSQFIYKRLFWRVILGKYLDQIVLTNESSRFEFHEKNKQIIS